MFLPLQQEISELINNRYDVLETINLVEYDCDINQLVILLRQYQDFVFESNQRIVILHHDTDYYQNSGVPEGNTMFNLFTLLSNFNIACEKILFVTNHYGIEIEIEYLVKHIFNSTTPQILYTSLWYDFPKLVDITETKTVTNKINSIFCCLNGIERQHRVLTLCYLKAYDLLRHGVISYFFKK